MKKQKTFLFVIITLFLGCREPYDPSLENGVVSYLVVEGMINASGVTTIQLSRSRPLSEKEVKQFETGATIEIESDDNNRFALTDRGEGVYTSAANMLPQDRKYRLRIKTSAGKEYLSAFAAVKVTSAVTASWHRNAEGVEITASTADPSKTSLYYQWLTEETWEINSPLVSQFVVVSRTPQFSLRRRTLQERENAYRCWATLRSGNILTANTSKQSDDLVKGFPLVKIPNGSEKLAVRYSILVSQYAISKEAYEFYEVMKKNTEKMGSIFDPQPSLIRGNITCTTDPGEIVVGFIDCSVSSSQRIFITSEEAGNWKSSLVCQTSYVQNSLIDLRRELSTDAIMIADPLIADYAGPTGEEIILGYNIARADCLDCRLRGNNVKPDFW